MPPGWCHENFLCANQGSDKNYFTNNVVKSYCDQLDCQFCSRNKYQDVNSDVFGIKSSGKQSCSFRVCFKCHYVSAMCVCVNSFERLYSHHGLAENIASDGGPGSDIGCKVSTRLSNE